MGILDNISEFLYIGLIIGMLFNLFYINEERPKDQRLLAHYIISLSIIIFVGFYILFFKGDGEFPIKMLVVSGILIASTIFIAANGSSIEVKERMIKLFALVATSIQLVFAMKTFNCRIFI